jgi:hypothetical protein
MWPKQITKWIDSRVLYMSIPFTWLLSEAKGYALQTSYEWDTVVVGGPAVMLIPGFFRELSYVTEGKSMPGILQRVNPEATRTTIGCIRNCQFCGVKKIEPVFEELANWPDRPVLCDNNILAASDNHFDLVCDRLEKWGWCDFNQGIDARFLTPYHAERFKRIGKPILRLALDNLAMRTEWEEAFVTLRNAGIAKKLIRSYCLVGFNDNPDMAWDTCKYVESFGVTALPMWFHELNALEANIVTEKQKASGWNDYERRRIMQWFYQHKKAVRPTSMAQEPPQERGGRKNSS